MKLPLLPALLLLLLPQVVLAQDLPPGFLKEWPDFRQLEPRQVRELPAPVRADLEQRGCRIPRFTKWDGKHNAIQGKFLHPGAQDWAILCAASGKTVILIYPDGTTDLVQPLRSEDADPHRFIHAVTPFVLEKRALRDQEGEQPTPQFDHDGIEDGPIGKPGRVVYFREGEWTLQ